MKFKKELLTHFLVTLMWLGLIAVWKTVFKPASFSTTRQILEWFWFCLGAILGTMILDLDQLIHALFLYPEEEAKNLWNQRKIKELLNYLAETSWKREKLFFHNVVFQVVLMILFLWVVTSVGNSLVEGMIMAMNLHIIEEEIYFLLKGQEKKFRQLFFWPLKKEIGIGEERLVVVLMVILFLGITLFLI